VGTRSRPNLYESMDASTIPPGWRFDSLDADPEDDGGKVIRVRTEVTDPKEAKGLFERAFNSDTGELELRLAFLRLSGLGQGVDPWVKGGKIDMIQGRGTPTVHYVTLCQMKALGISGGAPSLRRRIAYLLKKWLGRSLAGEAVITKVKMSTIQNIETIVHLHWLQQKHPGASRDALLIHTASVRYAETTLIQSGYRREGGVRFIRGPMREIGVIGDLMNFQEDGNLARIKEHNDLLARHGFDRNTIMEWNFDIEFDVSPQ
jgi:hypothetical protein